jgi:hypothetical protein
MSHRPKITRSNLIAIVSNRLDRNHQPTGEQAVTNV